MSTPSNSTDSPAPVQQIPTFSTPEEKAQWEVRMRKQEDYLKFKHYAAVGMIILCPTLAIMPPRKFDLYTAALGAGFVASASQLSKERYGVGLIDLAGRFYADRSDHRLQGKKTFEIEKEKEAWVWSSTEKSKEIQQQIQESRQTPSDDPAKRSLLQRIWLGNESANWREERAREHAEALERGETIGDLIRQQVSEVMGFKDEDEEEEKKQAEEAAAAAAKKLQEEEELKKKQAAQNKGWKFW